jgi:hypothetical protein
MRSRGPLCSVRWVKSLKSKNSLLSKTQLRKDLICSYSAEDGDMMVRIVPKTPSTCSNADSSARIHVPRNLGSRQCSIIYCVRSDGSSICSMILMFRNASIWELSRAKSWGSMCSIANCITALFCVWIAQARSLIESCLVVLISVLYVMRRSRISLLCLIGPSARSWTQ